MSNKKITELTELTTPTTDDVLPLVDIATNATKKAQLGSLPISSATQTALDAKQETLVSGTNIKTINSTSLLGSGDISLTTSAAGTSGQIQFNDSSAFGADSNLFWDNTNKRLGVGTSSPTTNFQVVKNANSTTGLLVSNSDTTNLSSRASITVNSGGVVGQLVAISGNDVYMGALASTVRIGANGGTDMLINTSGNISMGTPSVLSARLGIKGSGSTSATTALLVQNSSGTAALTVKDDLTTTFGGTIFGTNAVMTANIQFNNILYGTNFFSQNTGATTLGAAASADASAMLDIRSTSRGLLPPRMTTTQKNAISSPAAGLQVYDSTTNRAAVYTSAWENVITETNGSPNSVYKLWSGSAAQYAALTPDSSTLYFVI